MWAARKHSDNAVAAVSDEPSDTSGTIDLHVSVAAERDIAVCYSRSVTSSGCILHRIVHAAPQICRETSFDVRVERPSADRTSLRDVDGKHQGFAVS